MLRPSIEAFNRHIFMCIDHKLGGCGENGADEIRHCLDRELHDRGIRADVTAISCRSGGFCKHGPMMLVYPDGAWYRYVQLQDVTEIVEEHFVKGRAV